MELKGKNAVVTGGAAGLGQYIAVRLAQECARVVVADVASADTTLELMREARAEADFVACDVSNEASVRDAVARARELCGGRIDVLINNAGINGETQLVQEMRIESWERTLRVNLTGTMLVSREIIPVMVWNGGGRIVNIASNVAKRGLALRADYVSSKWAVLGLTQTLALELAPHNIRVNAVCPGPIEGDRIEQVMQMHADSEGKTMAEIRDSWQSEAPMGRFIQPTEVAAVVLFLASDQSSAMTGQALNVTGGLIMG